MSQDDSVFSLVGHIAKLVGVAISGMAAAAGVIVARKQGNTKAASQEPATVEGTGAPQPQLFSASGLESSLEEAVVYSSEMLPILKTTSAPVGVSSATGLSSQGSASPYSNRIN